MGQTLLFLSTIDWIILGSIFLLFLIQLIYCFGVNGRVAFYKPGKQILTAERPPVSIILSARNEYETLQHTLPQILSQDYPDYEVIVVNDCSEDDSEVLLASLQHQYPHLVYRNIVKDNIFTHSKKMAIGVGIKASQHDLCLLIDADCFPESSQWLKGMQQFFTPKIGVVLGYTRLLPKVNKRWIRADRFMQALHYLGSALMHRPYMGVGSNMAFRKQLFYDNKGFDMRLTKNLREDRLFVNQVATSDNTAVAIMPDVVTVSTLKITRQLWFMQRCEELRSFALFEKMPRYPGLFESIVRFCYYIVMVVAIINFATLPAALFGLLAVEVIRVFLWSIVLLKSLRKLGEKGLWFSLLCWNFIYPIVHIAVMLASKFPPKQRKQA